MNGFAASESIFLDFCLGICDIGSATFNYDMRRLNEILDFPKAWYKRGLVQRLFLGKEGSYATKTSATGSEMNPEVPSPSTDEDLKRRYNKTKCFGQKAIYVHVINWVTLERFQTTSLKNSPFFAKGVLV